MEPQQIQETLWWFDDFQVYGRRQFFRPKWRAVWIFSFRFWNRKSRSLMPHGRWCSAAVAMRWRNKKMTHHIAVLLRSCGPRMAVMTASDELTVSVWLCLGGKWATELVWMEWEWSNMILSMKCRINIVCIEFVEIARVKAYSISQCSPDTQPHTKSFDADTHKWTLVTGESLRSTDNNHNSHSSRLHFDWSHRCVDLFWSTHSTGDEWECGMRCSVQHIN